VQYKKEQRVKRCSFFCVGRLQDFFLLTQKNIERLGGVVTIVLLKSSIIIHRKVDDNL